jgi:tetratricopeptide (TPR) repeat protein
MGPDGMVASNGVGELFVHKKMLIKQHGVRVNRGAGTNRLLMKNGKLLEVGDGDLGSSIGGPPIDRPVRSAAGGLIAWISAIRSKMTDENFSVEVLASQACEMSSTDLFQARRLGQDMVSFGTYDLVDGLALPDTERAWLALVGAARWGDAQSGLAAIARLPAGGYRAKVKLIGRLWPWFRGMSATELLRPHITPFAQQDPFASALLVLLGSPVSVQTSATLVETLANAIGADVSDSTPLRASLKRLERGTSPRLGTNAGRADRLLSALDPGCASGTLVVSDVANLPLTLCDDLIDLGRFSTSLVGAVAIESTAYLTARTAPGLVPDATIDDLGFEDEKIRRALVRRDLATLQSMAHHPAAKHSSALLGIIRQRTSAAEFERVLAKDRSVVEDLLAVYRSAESGQPVEPQLTDRLLADVSVWPVLHETLSADQLPVTSGLRVRQPAFAEWLSLANARELLYRGRWSDAINSARSCLELATDEAVRDEALNLLACGLFQRGEHEAAIASLEKALEGAYSESLLANIGVVAAGLQPELAAKYLGELASEAPTVDLKLAAVRRIITMWSSNVTTSWEGSSTGNDFPTVVREPVRSLLLAQIPLDDFRHLIELLSFKDTTWLTSTDLSTSPHAATLEARFFLARAHNWGQMVEVMASIKGAGTAPAWFDREIEDFSNFILNTAFEELQNDSTEKPGIAELALKISDTVERLDPVLDAKLLLVGSALLLDCFQASTTTASEAMAMRLERGRRLVKTLSAEAQDALGGMASLAHKKLAFNYALASIGELDALIDRVNALADRIRRAPDVETYQAKLAAARLTAERAAHWRSMLAGLVPHVDDMDARRLLQERLENLRSIETEALGLM